MDALLQQFNEMRVEPIVEFLNEYEEWDYITILADERGLSVQFYNNIEVEWDEAFSLDEHLQSLYEVFSEYDHGYQMV